MKNQALFPSKVRSKKLKCHLLHFLFGALRVNITLESQVCYIIEKMNITMILNDQSSDKSMF